MQLSWPQQSETKNQSQEKEAIGDVQVEDSIGLNEEFRSEGGNNWADLIVDTMSGTTLTGCLLGVGPCSQSMTYL